MVYLANTKNKYKKTDTKKWVIIFLVIIGIVFAILYFYKWHLVKEQEKYINSYLISSNTISLEMNDLEEIDNVLAETGSYYFVYIGYTQDESVYKLEKELKPTIDEYDLHNNFYYLNVTDIMKKKNYLKDIAVKLNIPENTIKRVPIILYFKDGKLVEEGIYTAKDFKEVVENMDNM